MLHLLGLMIRALATQYAAKASSHNDLLPCCRMTAWPAQSCCVLLAGPAWGTAACTLVQVGCSSRAWEAGLYEQPAHRAETT
jgi:hypothetical protein